MRNVLVWSIVSIQAKVRIWQLRKYWTKTRSTIPQNFCALVTLTFLVFRNPLDFRCLSFLTTFRLLASGSATTDLHISGQPRLERAVEIFWVTYMRNNVSADLGCARVEMKLFWSRMAATRPSSSPLPVPTHHGKPSERPTTANQGRTVWFWHLLVRLLWLGSLLTQPLVVPRGWLVLD